MSCVVNTFRRSYKVNDIEKRNSMTVKKKKNNSMTLTTCEIFRTKSAHKNMCALIVSIKHNLKSQI